MIDRTRLRTLAQAATPGPWEQGDRYRWAGVMSQFGDDKCAYCGRLGEPIEKRRQDINGKVMPAHLHVDPEPYEPDHRITVYGGGEVCGNYGYEVGGVVDAADCAFIAAADPSTVLALLARLDEAEGLAREVESASGDIADEYEAEAVLSGLSIKARAFLAPSTPTETE